MENCSNWKQRLSASQLEKKRAIDRTSQRKSRLNSKRTQEEYRERFLDLVEKDSCSLLRRLVQENMKLHDIHTHYQSKMDSMALLSKDCLDVGCGSILDFLPSSSSTTKRFKQDSHSDSNDTSSEVMMRSVRPTINAPSQPSIMVQVAKVMKNRRPGSPANFPINDLVESIMVWKLTHFQTLGSEFLVTHLGLDKSPLCITAEKARHAIAAADFYTLILSKFYTGERILALNTDIIVEDTLIQMPAMAQQRRLIAYYVGILLQEYRGVIKGKAELLSQFWILYTFFTFLIFPTEDNFKRTPSWLWPTNQQFEYEHPASIDFICWPNLRSKLAETWKQYDIDELVAIMGESFELAEFTGKHCPVPIYVVPGTSDLEVDSDFRAGIFNLQNYSLGAKFTDRYPDLGPHIT